MAENRIRRLAVVENGRLVGVVALGDLAVRDAHDRKAGRALSEISKTSIMSVCRAAEFRLIVGRRSSDRRFFFHLGLSKTASNGSEERKCD